MNDDRSPDSAPQAPIPPEGAREPWYDRLLQLLHVKPRDSIRDDLEDALAEAGADPTFSPKGDLIAFESNRTAGPEILVMGSDGSTPCG